MCIRDRPIDSFNRIPTNYLTNAEGDYIYDLVIVGASAYNEPDISGAAAWALADYAAALSEILPRWRAVLGVQRPYKYQKCRYD